MKNKLYQGTADYIASEELKQVVNASLAIGRPLLLKGEPGTGKTLLARSIAEGLGRPLLRWNIKSTTKAQEGLYVYDTVQRLNYSIFAGKSFAIMFCTNFTFTPFFLYLCLKANSIVFLEILYFFHLE